MDSIEKKFMLILSIIAAAMGAGAFALSWQSSNHFFDFSPANDGYVAPRDISRVIDETQESTVLVVCSRSKKDSWIGTGWAINSELLKVSTSKTAIMTNYHVIDECLNGRGEVSIALLHKKERPAEILSFDEENDLAVLVTDVKLPTLDLSENSPWPGYWVMALGSAAAHEGSVAFGAVLNVTDEDILITNNISEGNSGGPLVDNEGKVIGIVTWGMDYKREQYNGARILDVFCFKLLKCQYNYESEPTWFEYKE